MSSSKNFYLRSWELQGILGLQNCDSLDSDSFSNCKLNYNIDKMLIFNISKKIDNNSIFFHFFQYQMQCKQIASHIEVSELLVTSNIQQQIKTKLSELVIETLRQQPHSKLSDILLNYSLKLYEQAIKSIAAEALSQIQQKSIKIVENQQRQEQQLRDSVQAQLDLNSKLSVPSEIKTDSRISKSSQINPQFILLKLKSNISYQLCFQLFRNYASKKKLQIIQDYGFKIIFKDKSSRKFGSLLECIKPLSDPTINIAFIASLNVLRMELIERAKYKKFHQHYITLQKHAAQFRKELWNYGCIQIDEQQTGSFITESIHRQISSILKVNKMQGDNESEHIVKKYIISKKNVMIKYQSNISSEVAGDRQIQIQREISRKLNIYQKIKQQHQQQYKNFYQSKDRILGDYFLKYLLKWLQIQKQVNIPNLYLPQSTRKLLQSETITQNINGVKELCKTIMELDEKKRQMLPWIIIFILYNNTDKVFFTIKLLQVYFKNQDQYEQQEEFILKCAFAFKYIKDNMYKDLLGDLKQ